MSTTHLMKNAAVLGGEPTDLLLEDGVVRQVGKISTGWIDGGEIRSSSAPTTMTGSRRGSTLMAPSSTCRATVPESFTTRAMYSSSTAAGLALQSMSRASDRPGANARLPRIAGR